jgi:hypothetical protein
MAMERTPDGQAAALSLERYAEVVAHLRHFKEVKPSVVIERLGVERSDWASAERTWSRAIGDEISRQETTLALLLAEAFAAEQQRLEATRPTLETIHLRDHAAAEAPAAPAAPEPASPPAEAPPEAPPAPEPMPVPIMQLPTYALPVRQPASATPMPAPQPSPAAPEDPAPGPGPTPLEPAPPPGSATAILVEAPRGPALPFVESTSGGEAPPPLTITQYASLCVELERFPAHGTEILARYHLTAATKRALDRQYGLHFMKRADDWAAFQKARRDYEAWLAATQGKR